MEQIKHKGPSVSMLNLPGGFAKFSGTARKRLIILLMLFGAVSICLVLIFVRRTIRTYDFTAEQMTIQRLGILGQEIELFYKDCGAYPTTSQGLAALVKKPDDLSCLAYRKGGYHLGCFFLNMPCSCQDSDCSNGKVPSETFEELTKDGWAAPIKYSSNGKHYRIESSQGHILVGPPPSME